MHTDYKNLSEQQISEILRRTKQEHPICVASSMHLDPVTVHMCMTIHKDWAPAKKEA